MTTIYDNHADLAYTTVATAPSPATTGLTLVVAAGTGTYFPTPPFDATAWPNGQVPTPTNAEIVRVTDITVDTLTIVRGASPKTITAGFQISASITAKQLTDIEGAVAALEAQTPVLAQTLDGSGITGGPTTIDLTGFQETTYRAISLSSNLSLSITGAQVGDELTLLLKSNTHTFTPPTGTKWMNNTAPTLSGAQDAITFKVDAESGGVPSRLLGIYVLGFPA